MAITPFFLSALFFLSLILAIFAPLPLLVFGSVARTFQLVLAFIVNTVIIGIASGFENGALFVCFAAPIVFVMPRLFFAKRFSPEKTIGLTLLAMAGVTLFVLLFLALVKGQTPKAMLQARVTEVLTEVQKMANQGMGPFSEDASMEEIKQEIILTFPSGMAILALIVAWANFLLLIRVNPNQRIQKSGIDPSFVTRWKAPEYLVWPTIVAGGLMVFDIGWLSDLGTNFLRFFLAIYALQGLSILAYFFEQWKLQGFFRSLIYFAVTFLALPVLLAVGFFDLWFDFRTRFRQT